MAVKSALAQRRRTDIQLVRIFKLIQPQITQVQVAFGVAVFVGIGIVEWRLVAPEVLVFMAQKVRCQRVLAACVWLYLHRCSLSQIRALAFKATPQRVAITPS